MNMQEWQRSGKSQLRMGFRRFEQLEAPQVPPGYGLRTYRPGDADAWIAMLNTGDFGAWDRPRLDRMLSGERATLPGDGIFFATYGDVPVAAACAFFHPLLGGEVAELGWVVAAPEHRGHGLASVVCSAVLGFIGSRGHQYAYLHSEDFRLAALATYLRLGFEPELQDQTQPARWANIRQQLGARS